jgi:hypothetical protein
MVTVINQDQDRQNCGVLVMSGKNTKALIDAGLATTIPQIHIIARN